MKDLLLGDWRESLPAIGFAEGNAGGELAISRSRREVLTATLQPPKNQLLAGCFFFG